MSFSPRRGRTAAEWAAAFRSDFATAAQVLRSLLHEPEHGTRTWISRIDRRALETSFARLRAQSPDLPLYGVPFAVQDNIDAAGWITTAGCPTYAYRADANAPVIARMESAGAVLIGKTNLDQFASGLAGTRSPYGSPVNPFNPAHVPGGACSGAAVAVAEGRVPVALCTDIVGSARIPAAFNNLVGLKPTLGRSSLRGVVSACPSLDTVSVLTLSAADAESVFAAIQEHDVADTWSRPVPSPEFPTRIPLRLAIPRSAEWFGDTAAEFAWLDTLSRIEAMRMRLHPVDFAPLFELGSLLDHGALLAERQALLGEFIRSHPDAIDPVLRSIMDQGTRLTSGEYQQRRKQLLSEVSELLGRYDALLVPTAPTHPTVSGATAEPLEQDNRLARYTGFVNPADCCAIAVPGSPRSDGLPFGITMIAPAWHERSLLAWARQWQRHAPWLRGATGLPCCAPLVPAPDPSGTADPSGPAARPYLQPPPRIGRQRQSLPVDNQEKHA